MTHPDELHRLVDALPEETRDEARGLLISLLRRNTGDLTAESELDAIAHDPERRARFAQAIDIAWQESERGEGRPVDEVFAEIRARRLQS